MKFSATIRLLIFVLFFITGFNHQSSAQTTRKNDLILKRDSVKIEALILEVDETTIRYKKYSDQDGPVFAIYKTEVASITYGNGEVESFKAVPEIYFDEAPAPVTPYENNTPPVTPRSKRGSVSSMETEQLRKNYDFYLKKAARYKKLNLIGIIGGVAFIGGGIGLMSSGINSSNLYGGNSGYAEAYGGALLFMAGLGGGIPLTIIGAVKKRSYTKKALLVQEELRRRRTPVSFNISPLYNPANQSAGLALRMVF